MKNSTCKTLRARILAYLAKFVCPRALSMLEEQTITPRPGLLTSTEWSKKSGALPFPKGINTLPPLLISEIFIFSYNPLPATALVETPLAVIDDFLVSEPPHFLLLLLTNNLLFFFSFLFFLFTFFSLVSSSSCLEPSSWITPGTSLSATTPTWPVSSSDQW